MTTIVNWTNNSDSILIAAHTHSIYVVLLQQLRELHVACVVAAQLMGALQLTTGLVVGASIA